MQLAGNCPFIACGVSAVALERDRLVTRQVVGDSQADNRAEAGHTQQRFGCGSIQLDRELLGVSERPGELGIKVEGQLFLTVEGQFANPKTVVA